MIMAPKKVQNGVNKASKSDNYQSDTSCLLEIYREKNKLPEEEIRVICFYLLFFM